MVLVSLLLVGWVGLEGLRWTAPAECPDEVRARTWIDDELAGREAVIDAGVSIEPAGEGWVARVETGGTPRVLEDPDCVALARAVAVVIAVDAVAAAPLVPEPEVEAEPEPEPEPEAEPAPELEPALEPAGFNDDESPQPAAPTRPPPTPHHRLGLALGVAWGPVPAVAGSFGARYRGGRGPWELGVDATYQTPRVVRYPDDRAGGRMQSVSAAGVACGILPLEPVEVPLCFAVEGGGVLAEGVEAFETRRATGAWGMARADAGVRYRFGPRFELSAEAQGGIAFVRPAFQIGQRDSLRASRLLARGLVSVIWRLR